jgi:hypothetical protein
MEMFSLWSAGNASRFILVLAWKSVHKYAHRFLAQPVETGRTLSQKATGQKLIKALKIKGFCPVLTLPVAEIKLERAKGFEPSTFTLAT